MEFSNFIFPARKAIYVNNLMSSFPGKINGKQNEIKSIFENFHEKQVKNCGHGNFEMSWEIR